MKHSLLKKMKQFASLAVSIVMIQFLMVSVSADDTDILDLEKPPAPANVLMVFDSSGSMNWSLSADKKPVGSQKSRLQTLRTALSKALDAIDTNPKIPDINIGLMNFSGHKGKWLAHGPAYPVVSLKMKASAALNLNSAFTHPGVAPLTSYLPVPATSDTGTEYLKKVSQTWSAKNKTPIVDALYEAARYMKGDKVLWGRKPPNDKRAAHPSTYSGLISINGTSTTTNVCKYEACGDGTGVACNATMTNCSTSTEATHNCYLGSEAACLAANPTYTSCTAKSWESCKDTCPSGQYDEAGKCLNPVTVCKTKNYFKCVEPINSTTCEHEVCKDVTTVDGTVTGSPNYNSPITKECQSSHIVLLSDGAPTVNNSASDVASYIGSTYANGCDSGTDFARCGKELAKYLAKTDHQPSLDGDHRINVHTIGLSLSSGTAAANKAIQNLKDIADYGDGKFNLADTPEQLAKVLEDVGLLGLEKARSFSSPSYSLDPNALLKHGDDVYLPMFQNETSSVWSGNLKKFKIVNGQLVDKLNTPATDSQGNLVDGTKDFWFKAGDANKHPVNDGGVARLLNPDQRKLYSDKGLLSSSYASLKAKLGNASMSNAHRNQLLNFIRGKFKNGKTRYHIGDIMHSKPVQVTYGSNKVIFVGTNEGFLHAFDSKTGKEIFAFMPEELLKNIEPQFDTIENGVKSKHLYGVDGEITVSHDDTNHNFKVDAAEKVVLYFGLRRGGKSFYALDVTTPAVPKLLWKKTMNAHSWSRPAVAKLMYKPNTAPKTVVIVGGGYSDNASGVEIAGAGNAVYILDAKTGATVWKKSVSNPVPAPITVLDLDRNGTADRLYFSDTGGNIWRADLNAGGDNNLNNAQLTKFASFGASHKFFVEPDIAIFKHKGQYVLSVSIGSGERPNPTDTSNADHFFALFDEYVYQIPPSTQAPITLSDLADAPTSLDLISKLRTKKGWKYTLNTAHIKGEKILSPALTFQNMVMFTSFGMGDTTLKPKTCDQSTATLSSLYALELLSGKATFDLNGDGSIDQAQDSSVIVGEGILGTPQVVFGQPKNSSGGACKKDDCVRTYNVCVGRACFASNSTKSTQPGTRTLPKVYWIDHIPQ
jgi:outer membrane protein assembly factor BamB